MELPITLFFGAIGTAFVIGLLGVLRDPPIPEAMFITGIFILFISIMTDTLTVGDPILQATNTSGNVTNSTTTYQYVANTFQFTQMVQVIFSLMGAVMMIVGVAEGMRNG